MMSAIQTAVGAATDAGRARELNEDAICLLPPVFAVADGMGGHAAGEVAASLALAELSRLAGRHDLAQSDLLTAIEASNDAILAWSASRLETVGMGTTLTGVCLGSIANSPHWFIFNVGDSRVYRLIGDALVRVTVDHSEVEELVTAGAISADDARSHPRRNVVTRSLGTSPAPIPDIWVLPASEGDLFMICSDGLPLEVAEPDIAEVLARRDSPQQAADALVQLALAGGGRDNVSVVVVCIPDAGPSNPADISTAPRPHGLDGLE
jgi:serine/threonine protein phosphatase PrpC